MACFGKPECQVIGGDNFAADGTPGDPFDGCNGHGTFVASRAAGRASAGLNFVGAAPEAKIRAYKVFSCDETGAFDAVIAALVAAFNDGVDVLNLSLGDVGGFNSDPTSKVVTRIVSKGVAVVVSAGNDGEEGAFYAHTPASADSVVSVGSIENVGLATFSIFAQGVSDGEKEVSLLALDPFSVPEGKLSLKIIGPSLSDLDGCDPDAVAAAGPFNNSVVLVSRSNCPKTATPRPGKFRSILDNGGRYVLAYAKTPPFGISYTHSIYPGLQAATISRADGAYLKQQIGSGHAVEIDFSRQVFALKPNSANGGRMCASSTQTPTWDMTGISLSAPGGNVLGAYPFSEFPGPDGLK